MANLSNGVRSARHLPCHAEFLRQAMMAVSFVAVFSTPAAGQDKRADAKSDQKAASTPDEKKATFATGVLVSELGESAIYVFQAKNNDYWFGSNDRGVYRYDGKSLVNFTTKDGLVSDRIRGVQEDKSGNIYFTTYEGISKYDGQALTTLSVAAGSAPTHWKRQPEDLWFVGPPDAGVVYRYDGKSFEWLTDKILTEAPVRSIFEDKKGNFWFSYSGEVSLDGIRVVNDFDKLGGRCSL